MGKGEERGGALLYFPFWFFVSSNSIAEYIYRHTYTHTRNTLFQLCPFSDSDRRHLWIADSKRSTLSYFSILLCKIKKSFSMVFDHQSAWLATFCVILTVIAFSSTRRCAPIRCVIRALLRHHPPKYLWAWPAKKFVFVHLISASKNKFRGQTLYIYPMSGYLLFRAQIKTGGNEIYRKWLNLHFGKWSVHGGITR